jgi:hypothetical protein
LAAEGVEPNFISLVLALLSLHSALLSHNYIALLECTFLQNHLFSPEILSKKCLLGLFISPSQE